MEIAEMKQNVARNIYYLRTANNMTQSELAAKLNYSDKAVSKWERAEGAPDVFVLHQIGEIFGVSVDYLLSRHSEQEKKPDTKPVRNLKKQISSTVFWGIIAVAVVLSVILYLTTGVIYWHIFIYSVPITCIVQIVLSAVWWRGRGSFIFTSLLVWSILLTVYVSLFSRNYWQIFFIGVPAQIIVFLAYRMKISVTITRKSTSLFSNDSEASSDIVGDTENVDTKDKK